MGEREALLNEMVLFKFLVLVDKTLHSLCFGLGFWPEEVLISHKGAFMIMLTLNAVLCVYEINISFKTIDMGHMANYVSSGMRYIWKLEVQ